ncbi:MAG: hypothetical protein JRF69_12685 [Deltaproteobacteria bacterium]|nr:hypothetical protein [Deltaproteobacteria bacterium]
MGQIHQASSVLGWELVPGSFGKGSLGESYRINSASFRGPEQLLGRRSGINRIMVIGDSFTFGMGVNLDDTYPKQLEQILNRKGIACEVINCGVIYYQMWQYYEVLKRKVIPYQPDLVIVGLFADDLAESIPPYKQQERYEGHNPFDSKGESGVMSYFSLWNFCKNADALFKYRYRYRTSGERGYLKSIENRKKNLGAGHKHNIWKIMSGEIKQDKSIAFSETLQDFAKTAKHQGIEVLIALIPDSIQLNDPHLQVMNGFVDQVCSENGISFIDLTPFLEAEKDHLSLYLFPYDAHNSP